MTKFGGGCNCPTVWWRGPTPRRPSSPEPGHTLSGRPRSRVLCWSDCWLRSAGTHETCTARVGHGCNDNECPFCLFFTKKRMLRRVIKPRKAIRLSQNGYGSKLATLGMHRPSMKIKTNSQSTFGQKENWNSRHMHVPHASQGNRELF